MLPASNAGTNGELLLELESTEQAWAACAAKVDMIIQHNEAADD